jgi:hypothetical protein
MWNVSAELARIRRQELLNEAATERLARAAQAARCDANGLPADLLRTRQRRVSESVVR